MESFVIENAKIAKIKFGTFLLENAKSIIFQVQIIQHGTLSI